MTHSREEVWITVCAKTWELNGDRTMSPRLILKLRSDGVGEEGTSRKESLVTPRRV